MSRLRLAVAGWCALVGVTSAIACRSTQVRDREDVRNLNAQASEKVTRALVQSYVRSWRLEVITSRRLVPEFMRHVLPIGSGARAIGSIADQLGDARVPCFGGPQSEGDYNLRFDVKVRDRIPELRLLGAVDPGYCPFWEWGLPAGAVADGTGAIASRLPLVAQQRLNALRDALLRGIDSVLRSNPSDSISLGQRVRFSITPEQIAVAVPAVERCALSAAYCLQLRARLEARLQHSLAADSLYRQARSLLDASGHCRIDGLDWSWPASDSDAARGACTAYIARREKTWWLANPRWSAPINVRLLAHENRRFDVLVREQVGLDELLDFAPRQRASAIALVMRYGFPRRVLARHVGADTSYMSFVPHDGDEVYRFIGAPQYSLDYYRTIPDPSTIQAPFDAALPAFAVRAPPPSFNLAAEFPKELMDAEPQLHDLTSAQLAHFMRDSLLVLAVAVPMPPSLSAGGSAAAAHAALVSSPGPGAYDVLSASTVPASASLRALGLTQMAPSVLSVEVEPYGAPVSDVWRARFGQRPSQALVAAVGGAPAMSDLMLVDVASDSLGQNVQLETIHQRMLASSVVAPEQLRLGVFWELYGLNEGGTIRYTVTVTSNRGPGMLSRIFAFARGEIQESGNAVSIALSKRVDPRSTLRTQRGALVVPDGLVLDLRGLPEGDYTLQVSAASDAAEAKGEPPFLAQSARIVRVQSPRAR